MQEQKQSAALPEQDVSHRPVVEHHQNGDTQILRFFALPHGNHAEVQASEVALKKYMRQLLHMLQRDGDTMPNGPTHYYNYSAVVENYLEWESTERGPLAIESRRISFGLSETEIHFFTDTLSRKILSEITNPNLTPIHISQNTPLVITLAPKEKSNASK